MSTPSLGHATALEIRRAIGCAEYQTLAVFGFVRHPIEKLVSSYFFSRAGSVRRVLNIKAIRYRVLKIAKNLLRLFSAKVLPLPVWCLVYRMRSCTEYFCDTSGHIIVDHMGCTERLGPDLAAILSRVGMDVDIDDVPHTNRSSHSRPEDYPIFRHLIPFFERRYKADIALHRKVEHGVWENQDVPVRPAR